MSIDDYELKIRKLLRHSKFKKEILDFDRDVFLDVTNDKKFTFPLFKPTGAPYEINRTTTKPPTLHTIQPPTPPKQKGLFARFMNCFASREDKLINLINEQNRQESAPQKRTINSRKTDFTNNLAADLEQDEANETHENVEFFTTETEWQN